MKKYFLSVVAVMLASTAMAQSISEKYQRFLTDPEGYVVYRATGDIKVDGILDEPTWQNAPVISNFADISGEGFPAPRQKTEARILWDDEYLYVGAMLHETNVWGDIKNHDEVVYYNPDFEVFIDPDNDAQNYFEIETNALATVFDLFVQKPYRVNTRAFVTFAWDTPGLKLDTHVYGTLNDDSDTDKGWAVEMAIPRKALAAEFDNYLKAGSYWRLGFSRVEWQTEKVDGKTCRKKGADGNYLPEDNWTWPATGMIAMHMPERWNYIYLSDKPSGTDNFVYPEDHMVDKLLWAMYYAQEDQLHNNGSYFTKLKDFKLTKEELAWLPEGATINVEATAKKFEITVKKVDGSSVSVDENSCICRRKN